MSRGTHVEPNGVGIADIITEMDARNFRPDLFALADDLFEAELIRSGRLSIEPVKTSGPIAA